MKNRTQQLTPKRERCELPMNGDSVIAMIMDIDVDGVASVNANLRPGKAVVHGQHALGGAQPREVGLFYLRQNPKINAPI